MHYTFDTAIEIEMIEVKAIFCWCRAGRVLYVRWSDGGDMRAGSVTLGVIAATARASSPPTGDEVSAATVRPLGYRLLHVALTGFMVVGRPLLRHHRISLPSASRANINGSAATTKSRAVMPPTHRGQL